eukprot:362231-Chlamydomonas_euryale.AAC.3
MVGLRTVCDGVPFVTAPNPLLDPLCLAALNTGILVGPLHVPLTPTLYANSYFLQQLASEMRCAGNAVKAVLCSSQATSKQNSCAQVEVTQ